MELLNNVLYNGVLFVILLAAGLFFSFRLSFLQFRPIRLIHEAFQRSKGGGTKSSGVSPYRAFSSALAGIMGAGNIIAVAQAVALGGAGALFWIWASAFLCMSVKYYETVLAVRYREKDAAGNFCGGPMVYIGACLGNAPLACIFSISCIAASFGVGNMVQTGAVADSVGREGSLPVLVLGGMAVVCALAVFGGLKRISSVTAFLVPAMTIVYVVGVLIVIAVFRHALPQVFSDIFHGIFKTEALCYGGFAAAMAPLRYGVARGLLSHEAGMGSAPIAHAGAETDNPHRQGVFGILEVYADTIVVGTLTCLAVLCAGIPLDGASGTLAADAFTKAMGSVGGLVVRISVILFALCSCITWSYYGARCMDFLFRKKSALTQSRARTVYLVAFCIMVFVGGFFPMKGAMEFSDFANGLMAVINTTSVFLILYRSGRKASSDTRNNSASWRRAGARGSAKN